MLPATLAGYAGAVIFGGPPSELPSGVSLEDFCKAEEHLQPFVDNLLSAREGLAHKLGTDRKSDTFRLHDAGTD